MSTPGGTHTPPCGGSNPVGNIEMIGVARTPVHTYRYFSRRGLMRRNIQGRGRGAAAGSSQSAGAVATRWLTEKDQIDTLNAMVENSRK